jgi:hypothetical protein
MLARLPMRPLSLFGCLASSSFSSRAFARAPADEPPSMTFGVGPWDAGLGLRVRAPVRAFGPVVNPSGHALSLRPL